MKKKREIGHKKEKSSYRRHRVLDGSMDEDRRL